MTTTIALSQPFDQSPTPEAEVGIAPNGNRAVVEDSISLREQARQIRAKVKKRQKSDLKFWWQTARELFKLRESCYQQFGETVGERKFRSLASVEFFDCDYVINAVMVIFEWLEKLPRRDRKLVFEKAGNWTALDTLKKLPKIPIELDKFFWLSDQHLLERGKPIPTAEAVQSLIDALLGKWQISWDKPLKVVDWAFLAGLTNHFSSDSLQLYFDSFEKARAYSHQIAKEKGREEVYLCDALAALKSLDYEIVLGEVVEPPSKEARPLYSESDLEKEREKARREAIASYEEKLEQAKEKEKARLEAIASYEEKLAQKEAELAAANAQLEQVTQQLQTATTGAASSLNNSIEELMAQIAKKDREIEWLNKRLSAALQDTGAPQTSPTSKLKIDDLAVVPLTTQTSPIFPHPAPPPIELVSYPKSAVYQNDWDSKKFQLSLVTNQSDRTGKSSRHDNARKSSTFSVKKGFARG